MVASYTDKGAEGVNPLTETTQLILHGNTFMVSDDFKSEGFSVMDNNGQKIMVAPKQAGWFALPSLDLTYVSKAEITVGWQGKMTGNLKYEAHLDSPEGRLLGSGSLKPQERKNQGTVKIQLKPTTDGAEHELYFTYKPSGDQKEDLNSGVMSVKLDGSESAGGKMAAN